MSLLVLNRLDVMEPEHTLVTYLDAACSSGSGCRTTDVERTHRQLCTRLTDRLGRDDTHGFTDADRATTRQITSVAGRTHAVPGLARDGRADQHLIHAFLFERPNRLLIEQRVLGEQHLFGTRLQNVFSDYATEDSLTQRLHHVTTLNERSHAEAV